MDTENVLGVFLRAEYSDYLENSENVLINELALFSTFSLHVCLGKMAQKLSAWWLTNSQLGKLPWNCSWEIYQLTLSCFRRWKCVNRGMWPRVPIHVLCCYFQSSIQGRGYNFLLSFAGMLRLHALLMHVYILHKTCMVNYFFHVTSILFYNSPSIKHSLVLPKNACWRYDTCNRGI